MNAKEKNRKAQIERETRETKIFVDLNIDGSGESEIETGIGFLDHMLESFSRHSLIDLKLKAEGDLHVDQHHTTEDTGIVIGSAIAKALGDFSGIKRFGSAVIPMDETLTRVAIDISKRPSLIWKVSFSKAVLGEMDTELFHEFFKAFCNESKCNLHIENFYGDNNHHIIESCFKSFARSVREALTVDERIKNIIPSSKGTL